MMYTFLNKYSGSIELSFAKIAVEKGVIKYFINVSNVVRKNVIKRIIKQLWWTSEYK